MEPTRSPLVLLVAQAVLAAAMLQQPSEGRVQAVAPSAPHLAGGKEAEAAAATSLPSSPLTGDPPLVLLVAYAVLAEAMLQPSETRVQAATSSPSSQFTGDPPRPSLPGLPPLPGLPALPPSPGFPGMGRGAVVSFAFAAAGQNMLGAADTRGTVRQLPDELQRAGAAENVLRRLQVARRRRRQDLPVPRHHGRPGYICRRDDRPATHARAASNVPHVHTAGASSDVPR
ncbi:hypothetical protein VPH35_028100 [Triticum aestivum]|uniref:uncharacterized protein n=1 Tax=Triticum aestivum TaxID=4565 RepID=UPI001D014652|nr:uncharacterized protein LOC123041075 [Triticum aestivum]